MRSIYRIFFYSQRLTAAPASISAYQSISEIETDIITLGLPAHLHRSSDVFVLTCSFGMLREGSREWVVLKNKAIWNEIFWDVA